jgi:ribosomal protein S12 methylthiotransferase
VDGAAANTLSHPIPQEVREERRARFMAVQEKISARRLQQKIGKTLAVLIDESGEKGAVGRSNADAPQIDGAVHINKSKGLKPGDLVQVRVTRSDAHDLYGEIAA